jgi:hypothetical protein
LKSLQTAPQTLQARVEVEPAVFGQPAFAEQYVENAIDGGAAAAPVGGAPSTQGNEGLPLPLEPGVPVLELVELAELEPPSPPLPPCPA